MVSTSSIIRELEQYNPMYRRFIFDETRLFLDAFLSDPDIAPKVNADQSTFVAGQGFINGYGSALDSDYDEEASDEFDLAEFSLALKAAPDTEPWQRARAAKFARSVHNMNGAGPQLYYSSYGFICGFKKGLADMEVGTAQSRAENAPLNAIIAGICEEAVEDVCFSYEPIIRWLAGEGIKKKSKARRAAKQIRQMVLDATSRYIASSCCGYSGFNDVSPQVAFNRADTYADAFCMGFVDACEGHELPGEYDLGDVPEEFLDVLGGFASTDAFYGEDLERADIAKREMVRYLLQVEEDYELDPYADNDEIPGYTDAFWMIHGIGYADGRFKGDASEKYHQEDSPANRKRCERLIEEAMEEEELYEWDFEDAPSEFGEVACRTIPVKSDAETLIERFEGILDEGEDVVTALSLLNAQSLVVMPSREDALAFGDYYESRYGKDRDVARAVAGNWGEFGPRILRIVESYR